MKVLLEADLIIKWALSDLEINNIDNAREMLLSLIMQKKYKINDFWTGSGIDRINEELQKKGIGRDDVISINQDTDGCGDFEYQIIYWEKV